MGCIVLATHGSLGDLHPPLALALELRRRGHEITIASSESYRGKAGALGLKFHPLRPDLLADTQGWARAFLPGTRGPKYLMTQVLFPAIRETHADLVAAVAGADLLIANELIYPAAAIAESTGLKWISYSLAPTSLFSVADPPLMPAPHWLQTRGPINSRALRWVGKWLTYRWYQPLRALRRELGLPPGSNPFFEGKVSPRLELALFSSALQPPQADWPASAVQCGFPFFDEAEPPLALPPPVAAFLSAGRPPVVFTLGSSAVRVAGDFYAESANAAVRLGRRALLLIGDNASPESLPPSILAWNYLPFARIFPHAAAIVHQGGVGTTAHAMRAGKPMLIVPFAYDQPDNAARIARLGAGRVIPRNRYRADRVARELSALLSDSKATLQGAELARQLSRENAVRRACDLIEQQL